MFKDYYSKLGVPFTASDEEIRQAYQSKVEALGEESSWCSSPNYQQRVDVEEAFRVLGASYRLKKAYDEEYSVFLDSEDKESFSIKDDWTQSEINSEHNFVVNHVLHPQTISGKNTKLSLVSKTLGCLGGCLSKILGIFAILFVMALTRTCTRHRMREVLGLHDNTECVTKQNNLLSNLNCLYPSSNLAAEQKLKKIVGEMNQSLPRSLNNNVALRAILLTPSALVYEYEVNDDYFTEFKSQILSLNNQIDNIKVLYSDMKPMIDLVLETHRGISYKYVCEKSGESNITEVSYSKLASI